MSIWQGEFDCLKSLARQAPTSLMVAVPSAAVGIGAQLLAERLIGWSCGSSARIEAVCVFHDGHGYWPPVVLVSFVVAIALAWVAGSRLRLDPIEGSVLSAMLLVGVAVLVIVTRVWNVS